MQLFGPNGISRVTFPAITLQVSSLGLMVFATVWYGCATWESQRVLFACGGIMAALMAVYAALAASIGKSIRGPNSLVYTLFALGGMALLQAQPFYGWNSNEIFLPPSVQMQRWALGFSESPTSIAKDLLVSRARIAHDGSQTPCALKLVPTEERHLACSVEPITTRAAAGNFFLGGLLVWIGSTLFSRRSQFPWLLGCMASLGIGISTVGIVDISLPTPRSWLGLGGNSFSVFVSKNSAGAFLNIALAAAFGFSIWVFHRDWKRRRPRTPMQNLSGNSPMAVVQLHLGKLTALQIASIFAVAWIAAAMVISQSLGAVTSGLIACLATIALVVPQKHRELAIVGAVLAILVGIGLIVFFQWDDKVLVSLNRLGEFDIESESRGGRLYIWNVSWHAALYYGWFGSGLGTFHFSSLPFQNPTSSAWFYHAESIYWEVAVTMGYLGAIAVLVSIAGCFRSLISIYVSRRFADFAPILVAGAFLLFSQFIHSAVDFALILPGVYVPAALLMGAALGSVPESHRVIEKLKWRKRKGRRSRSSDPNHTQPSWGVAIASVGWALAAMVALYVGWRAATPLAVAESIETQLQREEQLPTDNRSDHCVERMVEQVVRFGISIDECPYLLRFVAESICLDDRKKQWDLRSPVSDPTLAWMETAPFLIRLANDRIDDTKRDEWLRSIGGEVRLDRLRRASEYFARARAKSPLDWHSLWGNIYTSLDCSAEELVVFAPVVQRTSSHLPQLLTSASIFFNDLLTLEERLRLWKSALRISSSTSLGIGRLIRSQIADEDVPVEIFPADPIQLHKLVREVFTKKSFPRTHQLLSRRALDAIAAPSNFTPSIAALIAADLSSGLEDSRQEAMFLAQYLQYKPEDTVSWVRLLRLQIQNSQWKNAEASLRKLRQVDPAHPAIPEFSNAIRSQASNH